MSTSEKYRLFLSFHKTLQRLLDERLTPVQLKGALFFFNCPRCHAINPRPRDLRSECCRDNKSWQKFYGTHRVLKAELLRAEKQRRVKYRWHEPEESLIRYERLSKLLQRAGLPALQLPSWEEESEYIKYWSNAKDSYDYSFAAKLIREQMPDLVEILVD